MLYRPTLARFSLLRALRWSLSSDGETVRATVELWFRLEDTAEDEGGWGINRRFRYNFHVS